VAKVAASIASYGWTVPLLVTEDGEVIAGHGRLLAARHLGLSEVPVIRLSHLSPEQVRAYRVADNQLVLAGAWDEELLAAELHALNATGFDLDLTGFDQEELDRLLAPLDGDGDGLAGEDIICIGSDLIGQVSDLGVGLRVSDRCDQQATATGWLC
jgi:ParB-like chromosome segregation protein Spo0J